MINTNIKPKRGVNKYNHPDHGEVWYYITDPNGLIVVCADKSFGIGSTYHLVEAETLSEARKQGKSIKSKPMNDAKKSEKQLMNEFFDRVALKIPYNCMNCGKALYAYTKVAKRAVSAHILPKAYFESIKMDEDNIMFLGADYIGCPCNCHDRYDASVEIRITMPIYDFALKQFYKSLKAKLTSEELKRAYDYLNIEWK